MKSNWVCEFCDKNVFHYNRKRHLRHHHRLELVSRVIYDIPQIGGMYTCTFCNPAEVNLFRDSQIRKHIRQKHIEEYITKSGNSHFEMKD